MGLEALLSYYLTGEQTFLHTTITVRDLSLVILSVYDRYNPVEQLDEALTMATNAYELRYRGNLLGRVLEGERAVLGRSSACDIQLKNPSISRRHAVVEATEAGLTVTDAGSSHGVQVNGSPMGKNQSTVVQEGVLKFAEFPITVTRVRSEKIDQSEKEVARVNRDEQKRRVVQEAPEVTEPVDEWELIVPGQKPVRIRRGDGAVIGGDPSESDVVLNQNDVSGRHLIAVGIDKGLMIEDLGSLNGTFVGANPVKYAILQDGQTFRLSNNVVCRVQRARIQERQGEQTWPPAEARSEPGPVPPNRAHAVMDSAGRMFQDIEQSERERMDEERLYKKRLQQKKSLAKPKREQRAQARSEPRSM